MILIDLIYNLSVLVALSVLSAFMEDRWEKNSWIGQVGQGLLFGSIALIGMVYPLKLEEGLIFDGRTVVMSLCALFFGPKAGGVAILIPAIYRVILGGPGMVVGVLTILTAFQFGLLFHYWYVSPEGFFFSKRHLLLLGFLVHLAMILELHLLPEGKGIQTIRTVGLTIILFYPLATLLIGKILADQIEKKLLLRDLRTAAERYRITLESIGDGVITTDAQGLVKFMNPVAERLTGFSRTEALDQPIEKAFRIINEESRQAVENPIQRVLREGQVVGLANHTLLVSKEGRETPISDSGAPIRTSSGEILGVVLVFRDQTQERAFMQQLTENERKYRSLFFSTNDGIALHQLLTDPEGKPIDYILLDVNPLFERITGLKRAEVIGKRATEVYQQSAAPYLELYAQTALSGEPQSFDSYYPPMEKHIRITVFSPSPGQFATVFQDVTAQKLASERIAKELEEKKVLIREIHHRVKNNLQVILSFIRLRIGRSLNQAVKKELIELEGRIHVMARAQELLYESEDFLHLNLRQYLTDVVNHLRFLEIDHPERIRIQMQMEDIIVTMDKGIILGHVLTELVSNSFKHAFPNGARGEIQILLKQEKGGILLEVWDSGVGLPPGKTLEDVALTGLEIVQGYVQREAGGELSIDSSQGLRIKVFLPNSPQ